MFTDFPITRRADGSYVITQDGLPYHVPNNGEWEDLWAEVDAYAQEHAEQVTVEQASPQPTEAELLARAKAKAIAQIDTETSTAITAGFAYAVDGQSLHFSYDAFDQQNFADTANMAMLAISGAGAEGIPASVTWNAYKEDGELVRLTLDAQAFLALYTKGALAHKAAKMEEGGREKALVNAAQTVAEVEAIVPPEIDTRIQD